MKLIVESRIIGAGMWGFAFTPYEIIVYEIRESQQVLFKDNWVSISPHADGYSFMLRGSDLTDLCVIPVKRQD